MHRIDTSTAQKDKFGAGKDGFTSGNPQTGVPATEVSAAILDAWQEELCAVVEGAGGELEKGNNSQLLLAIQKLSSSRYFHSGQPLPVSNMGPIWHDDYASWMIWQEFTANGADYSGYASQLIGSLLLDTQPIPRQGYIKSGVQNLDRTTYAALRAWAMHNGRMVAPGAWQAGTIQCADNADGSTFRIYDVRGEFLRAWDDGRGVDSGRALFSSQSSATKAHRHTWGVWTPRTTEAALAEFDGTTIIKQITGAAVDYDNYPTASSLGAGNILSATTTQFGDVEDRPRNTSLLATIKF